MFLDYLDGMGDLSLSIKLNDFVELVRQYDTWEWSTKYNNQHAKQLNDLLYIIGRDRFVERFVEDIDPVFYEYEQLLLEIEQEKINRYIKSKAKQLQEYKIGEYKAGVVFAEQYQSQLGNELSKLNPELDFIAIINMANKTVSYRTTKENIHLGEIAKLLTNGGGHAMSAGGELSDSEINLFIKNTFNK